jgi:transposase
MNKRDHIPEEIPSTDQQQISALRERIRSGQLAEPDLLLLDRLLALLLRLLEVVQYKNASIKRLKRMLFGPSSDKRQRRETAAVPEKEPERASAKSQEPASTDPPVSRDRRGHGRLASSSYIGAAVARCQHQELKVGAACPASPCPGHLYDLHAPSILIHLEGQPLVGATRYEQQVLRCSACQARFTAPLPSGVKPEKYSSSCDVTIAVARYGAGLPFHRLARMQEAFGVPLAESVQFERCERVADAVLPLYLHLCSLAANGQVLYADDTRVKILSLLKENRHRGEAERTGMQTTAVVAEVEGHTLALYRSGRRHAGENIEELLRLRSEGLSLPIQMGDALSRNWDHHCEVKSGKCLAHGRRQFVELEGAFPAECQVVLDALGQVYRVEAETAGLSPPERLFIHQQRSGPVMAELREWIEKKFLEREVEPNSSLGKALKYLLKHWAGLTLFLREEGAPLDNNLCERALKLAVLNRKSSLFYRTEHGAAVGDILMSLIETCQLNGVSAWDYLLTLYREARQVRREPGKWLPWTYREQVRVRQQEAA